MPLDFQLFPVSLGGLDQKTSQLTRAPGKLERAINVEFDKTGRLNKRRGFELVDTAAAVNRFGDDAIMIHLATHRNELLVFTYDFVVAMTSKDEAVTIDGAITTAFVYRGPNNRGSCRLHYVSTSRTSQGTSG